jgi:3-oxoacyl-[acyl-carrier protein] reductase
MDLGITGRRALVTGASRGLGRACAEALAQAGVHLAITARGAEALEETAQALRDAHGVEVRAVPGDIAADAGRDAALAAAGQVDILVTNAGGPPPGLWRDWARADLQRALDANMLAPILLMQAVLPGMCDRGWGRVVNITSSAVKSPIPRLGLSNAARAGLTGFVAGTSRQVAGHGVAINNLLPGAHDTDRIRRLDAEAARREGITEDESRARRAASIPSERLGQPAEFGAVCAFLCSAHAGYIVGQNILLDGGAVAATI